MNNDLNDGKDVTEQFVIEEASATVSEEPKIPIHRRISEATLIFNVRIKNYKYLLQTVWLIAPKIAFIIYVIFSKNYTPGLNQEQLSHLQFKAVDTGPFAMTLTSHSNSGYSKNKDSVENNCHILSYFLRLTFIYKNYGPLSYIVIFFHIFYDLHFSIYTMGLCHILSYFLMSYFVIFSKVIFCHIF